MAKNSVDSKLSLVTQTQVRHEGELVGANDTTVTFKVKRRGGQRFFQRTFPRSRVLAYSADFIIVNDHAAVSSKVFRPINGQSEQDKLGWYVVDGIYANPEFAEIEADLGVPGGAAKKAAPVAKKAKKAA